MKRILAAALLLTLLSSNLHAIEFYVKPDGDDNNTGRIDPFRTIQRAQKAAREAAKNATGPIRILIGSGAYYLESPLVFTPEDSGTTSAPVVYSGFPGVEPVISGGARLECQWKPYKNGILETAIDERFLDIDQLFVNGQLYRMARYPNYDPPAKFFGGTSGDAIAPLRVKTWSNPLGGYLHALHEAMWGSKHYRITGVNQDGTLQLQGGWQENRGGGFDPFFRGGYHKDYLFVENIFEELDAPGEWFLDREKKVLYLFPQPGVDLAQAEIIGARARELLVFQGSAESPVRHIAFVKLKFKHTARIFMEPYERLLRGDWSIARQAAVRIQGSEDVQIAGCYFEDLGGNGVFLDRYNRRVTVADCRFTRLGESCVCAVGGVDAVRSPAIEYSRTLPQDEIDLTPGPKSANYPNQCVIENNLMYDFGLIGKQTAGVFLSMSEEIAVRHNTIFDCPRAAICINDGCWGGHVIEYNDVFNTVRESGDHGPLNSWGRDRYWKTSYNGGQDIEPFAKERALLDAWKTTHIRNNRFAHEGGHSWGIDLDDGSSNYQIYNNLCLGMGVKLREGFMRQVENNIIVQGFGGFHIWLPGCDDTIAHNIIVSETPYQFIRANPEYALQIDYNLFYANGAAPQVTGVGDPLAMADWQAKGFDVHSRIADPLFVDPKNGDYRVKPDSPALQLGFYNFPMDQFGVVDRSLRDEADLIRESRRFTAPRSETAKQRSPEKVQWRGATIKNLTGEAEKSAAGVGNETGVLFVEVPSASEAARTGFKTGDVAIAVNHTPVDTFGDFIRLLDTNKGNTVSVTVFNAVERTIKLAVEE